MLTGFTKLLVGVGFENSKVEVIDLESSSTSCKDLPNFPFNIWNAIGGLGLEDRPLICGGFNGRFSNKCFTLDANGDEWISSTDLSSERNSAAVSLSPFQPSSQKLLVTGGFNKVSGSLDTSEVLTENGWKTVHLSLPVSTEEHCVVLVNSTTIIVIGGGNNEKNSHFFNSETGMWTEGPQLKEGRRLHSCGIVRKGKEEFGVIVAGGEDVSYNKLSTVEMLDEGANEWRQGPELPYGINGAKMVEDQNGGVVLVGGYSSSGILDTLFQLSNGNEEWMEMKQKLKNGRNRHVAFLIPDNIANCS